MKNKLKIILVINRSDPYLKNVFNYCNKFNFKTSVIFSSNKRNEDLGKHFYNKDYDIILNYSSYYILSKTIISKASYGCLNFHPGPPSFRGSGIMSWAILNNEKYYGVTVHFIDEKIDHGEIIDVLKFKIPKDCDIKNLIKLTKKFQYQIFKKTINNIYKHISSLKKYFILIKNNPNYNWSEKIYKINQLDKVQIINLNLSKNKEKEIFKIIKATNIGNHQPVIRIKNNYFKLINNKEKY